MIEITQGAITFQAEDSKALASLFTKIANVTGAVKRVPKNRVHQQGWSFASWDDIADTLGEALGENHLAVIQSMSSAPAFESLGATSQTGKSVSIRTTVEIDVVVGDGDTGAMAKLHWHGHADDYGGEKGIDKALTYAEKSMFKKLFVISTGDDPEGDDVEVGPDYQPQSKGKKSRQQSQQQQQRPPQEPPRQSHEGDAPPTLPPKQDQQPSNITDINHTKTAFQEEARKLGYETADIKMILGYFGETKPDGTVNYSASRHDELMEKIKAWHDFYNRMKLDQSVEGKGELLHETALNELRFLGAYEGDHLKSAAAVREAIPVYIDHHNFTVWVVSVAGSLEKARGVIKSAGFERWSPKADEAMRRAISSVFQHINEEQGADEVVEEGATIEEVVANTDVPSNDPFDEGDAPAETAAETPAVAGAVAGFDDEFDSMFGGGISS